MLSFIFLHFCLQFYNFSCQQFPSWILKSLSQQLRSVFPFPTLHAFSWRTFSQHRNNFLSKTAPRSHSCAAPNQALGLRELNSWAVGYIGSPWQPGAHFSGLQRSLWTPKAEILHGHLNTQFEAQAARTKPHRPGQGSAKPHSSLHVSSSTWGRACQRPSHQTCMHRTARDGLHQHTPRPSTAPHHYWNITKRKNNHYFLEALMHWVGKDVLFPSTNSNHWTSMQSAAVAQIYFIQGKKQKEKRRWTFAVLCPSKQQLGTHPRSAILSLTSPRRP